MTVEQPASGTRVAVVAVGDELCNGDTVNGNAATIGAACASVGLSVVVGLTVPDDVDDIVAAVRFAASAADAVVVTGGLGPTSDDLTREGLARATGVGLHRDPALAEVIRTWAARRGRELSDAALRMAELPDGAEAFANELGTAPGIRTAVDGVPVYALPGVPREMAGQVADVVVPELVRRAGEQDVVTRTLRVAVSGESEVAEVVEAVPRPQVPARLAYLAKPGDVRVRLTGPAGAVHAWADRVAAALGDRVYGEGDDTLAGAVQRLLRAQGATVAVAESLTGGLVAAALTDLPGSSDVVRGGVVAYATDLKASVLGVEPELLERVGAVDADVAAQLAQGARARLGASHGVATTGVAGPTEQDGRPVGTVFVAVVSQDGTRVVRLDLGGDRELVRGQAAVHALDLLRRVLLDAGA